MTSKESESEDDDELSISIATDNHYKTRNDTVKWKRKIPSQRFRPSGINIVDANTIGPTQQVPQSFESPLEEFNLTLSDVCTDIVVRYINQKYEQYFREHPRGLSLGLIKLPKT